MRVLIVSTDPVERLRAGSALRSDDRVEIVEATSAIEGHHAVLEQDVDVIVVDGDLQPEGGFSMLYELRAAAELAGVPVPPSVVLAGRDQDRWLASWAGASDVVPKPVDAFDVAAAVRRLAAVEPA